MNNILNYDTAALKEEINKAIEEGRTQDVDQLVLQLLELEEFNETIILPDNFVQKIIWCGRKDKMKKVKIIKTAAISLALLLGISGTAYASVGYFQKVSFHDHGFVVSDVDAKNTKITDNTSNTENDETKKFSNKAMKAVDDPNDYIEVIDFVQGSKDTKWLSKTTSIDKTPTYLSDDGKKWRVDKEAKGTLQVEYQYPDFTIAADDNHMPKVLTGDSMKNLTLKNTVSYSEYHAEQKEAVNLKQLKAVYKDGSNGIMEVNLDWNKNIEDDYLAGKDSAVVIITGIEKSTNKRNYIAKDGAKYALEDNKRGDDACTTAILSCKGYQLILNFIGIKNDKIEQILDTIDSSKLYL